MTLPVSSSTTAESREVHATFSHALFPRRVLACLSMSPRAPLVAAQALHLAEAQGTTCQFLHVTQGQQDTGPLLRDALREANLDHVPLIVRRGKPHVVIREVVREFDIDLVVAGVLNRRATLRRHIQALAGRIASSLPCSVMLLTHPEAEPPRFKRCVLSVDFDDLSRNMLMQVTPWGRALGVKFWHVVHEYNPRDYFLPRETVPAESRAARTQRLKRLTDSIDWGDAVPQHLCITNRHGGDAIWYAQVQRADLLCLPISPRTQRFWERMFTFRLDIDVHALPCAMLLYRDAAASAEDDES